MSLIVENATVPASVCIDHDAYVSASSARANTARDGLDGPRCVTVRSACAAGDVSTASLQWSDALCTFGIAAVRMHFQLAIGRMHFLASWIRTPAA